jgi:O-antigen ligase
VGLGNAGFYFFDRMPAVGWGMYELRDVIYRASALPNIKSLWVRLLAETGIVGFVLFLSWYYMLWRSSRVTQHSRSPMLKMVALAGQLALIAFLVEGFSIDSFALPYFWVITGLISAAGAMFRNSAAALKAQN